MPEVPRSVTWPWTDASTFQLSVKVLVPLLNVSWKGTSVSTGFDMAKGQVLYSRRQGRGRAVAGSVGYRQR
jgi:hypothetical protein